MSLECCAYAVWSGFGFACYRIHAENCWRRTQRYTDTDTEAPQLNTRTSICPHFFFFHGIVNHSLSKKNVMIFWLLPTYFESATSSRLPRYKRWLLQCVAHKGRGREHSPSPFSQFTWNFHVLSAKIFASKLFLKRLFLRSSQPAAPVGLPPPWPARSLLAQGVCLILLRSLFRFNLRGCFS